jgi:hypothetical protein
MKIKLELTEKQFKRIRILIDDYVNLRINSRCQDRVEIESLNNQIKSKTKDHNENKTIKSN